MDVNIINVIESRGKIRYNALHKELSRGRYNDDKTRLGKRTFNNHINRLEKSCIIKVIKEPNANGIGTRKTLVS